MITWQYITLPRLYSLACSSYFLGPSLTTSLPISFSPSNQHTLSTCQRRKVASLSLHTGYPPSLALSNHSGHHADTVGSTVLSTVCGLVHESPRDRRSLNSLTGAEEWSGKPLAQGFWEPGSLPRHLVFSMLGHRQPLPPCVHLWPPWP